MSELSHLVPVPTDLVVDARCLQDPGFSRRGVGSHAASLLAGGQSMTEVHRAFRFVGLVDRTFPALAPDHRALFAELRSVAYDTTVPGPVLFCPSPMTHDPFFVARLQNRPGGLAVALVHDFIPYDEPDHYLGDAADRLAYYARLARLRHYDVLFPNSEYTRARLVAVVPGATRRVVVTGVALRDTMRMGVGGPNGGGEFILVPSGDDWRKNPDVVVRAHAASAILQRSRIRLTITGLHSSARQGDLRNLAISCGGMPDLVQFTPFLDDAALGQAYRDSFAVVMPSRSEGFSIPVIEASAQGAAVLVSDCAAHCELVPDPGDHFGPDDPKRLQALLEEALADESVRQTRRQRQAKIWERFHPKRVCERFWSGVLAACVARESAKLTRAHVSIGRRPSLAFLTPMPPAQSGCAEYSAATLENLARHAQISLFTETAQPAVPAGVVHVGRPQRLAHLASNFDAVVSVLGNSHFHKCEFDLLLENGAACIAHDARMLGFYWHLLGHERALEVASTEAGRAVSAEEIETWLANPGQLPVLFMSEIAAASHPLLTHSPTTKTLVKQLYGRPSTALPFAPYRRFADGELSPEARAQVRARLGLPKETLAIATFGNVALDRAPFELIWSVEQLRAWGFDARLAFVGEASPQVARMLADVARDAGIAPYISVVHNSRNEATYRDWLVGADVGVQLRTYRLGGLSGALLDCIAAGLPAVANEHLAAAMDAPDYVARIPDSLSAVLLAEAIASIVEVGSHLNRPLAQRHEVLGLRNFDSYSRHLLAALGFG
jgi:glycosyltransferase involved in cell wall biosynthesis